MIKKIYAPLIFKRSFKWTRSESNGNLGDNILINNVSDNLFFKRLKATEISHRKSSMIVASEEQKRCAL